MAQDIAKTAAFETWEKRETFFAHVKRILGFERLRLRGPCGANVEFLLAATAQKPRKARKALPHAVTAKASMRRLGTPLLQDTICVNTTTSPSDFLNGISCKHWSGVYRH